MKYLVMMLLLIWSVADAKEIDRVAFIEKTIKRLNPALATSDAKEISTALYTYSVQYGLDWRMMAAILYQESTLRRDPQQCFLKQKKCIDFGIAQINWKTWGKKLGLDKKRLITDVDYNINVMAHILYTLKCMYPKDKRWSSRYHSSTPIFRKAYESRIYPKYAFISQVAI